MEFGIKHHVAASHGIFGDPFASEIERAPLAVCPRSIGRFCA